MPKFDLQNRLIDFSVALIKAIDHLPNNVIGKYLKGQLTRSGTSPALNYAETWTGRIGRTKGESVPNKYSIKAKFSAPDDNFPRSRKQRRK